MDRTEEIIVKQLKEGRRLFNLHTMSRHSRLVWMEMLNLGKTDKNQENLLEKRTKCLRFILEKRTKICLNVR